MRGKTRYKSSGITVVDSLISPLIYNEVGAEVGAGDEEWAGDGLGEQGGRDDFQLNLKLTTQT